MPDVASLPRITQVDVLGDHALRLTFADGVVGDVAFEDHEWRGVLEPLRDPALFARVGIEMGTLCWPDELDMAPEPLYEEALANRVTGAAARR
ncbi:MAG: DUF2442 domain-containing protein [Solirubrobacteraceae bacterium]